MKRSPLAWLLLGMLLSRLPVTARAGGTILFAPDFSHGIPARWENVSFFSKKTDYSVVHEDTNVYLHAAADSACSALSVKLDLAARAKLKLHWRWRIDGVNTNGSERELAAFDHAARVFVAFDTHIGPLRSLNYTWANVEPPGTLLPHPKSRRTQLFVAESGNGRAGQWVTEERDLAADWARAFPGRPMPHIAGFGVMTDSDSLGGRLVGDYADIRLTAE